jgi:hypothetical protein
MYRLSRKGVLLDKSFQRENTYFYVDAYLRLVRWAEDAKSLLNISGFNQYIYIYETITSSIDDVSQEKCVELRS